MQCEAGLYSQKQVAEIFPIDPLDS